MATRMAVSVVGQAIGALPGLRFVVILTDGDMTNMGGDVPNRDDLTDLLLGCLRQLEVQGFPPDDEEPRS